VAMHNFRAEAFKSSLVTSDRMRDRLQTEAQQAVKDGLAFHEFKANVGNIGNTWLHHLHTEFVTAVNGAYGAREYLDQQAAKDTFPFIKYCTMNDERVRLEHMRLQGLVLPVDDEFWEDYYPPVSYNCRCYTESLTQDEAKDEPRYGKTIKKGVLEDIVHPDFKGNPAIDHRLFGWLKKHDVRDMVNEIADKYKAKHPWDSHKAIARPPKIDAESIASKGTEGLTDAATIEKIQRENLINYINDYVELLKGFAEVNGLPVDFTHLAEKFASGAKGIKDLKYRVSLLNCIPDALKKPTEVWFDYDYEGADKKRFSYLKKYDKNVQVVLDMTEDGDLYCITFLARKPKDKGIEKKRMGMLFYTVAKK